MEVMGKSSEVCHGNPSYHPSKRLGKKVNNKTLLRGKMGVNNPSISLKPYCRKGRVAGLGSFDNLCCKKSSHPVLSLLLMVQKSGKLTS